MIPPDGKPPAFVGFEVVHMPHAEVVKLTNIQCIGKSIFQLARQEGGEFFAMWFTRESGWLGVRCESERRASQVVSEISAGRWGPAQFFKKN